MFRKRFAEAPMVCPFSPLRQWLGGLILLSLLATFTIRASWHMPIKVVLPSSILP